MIDEDLTQGHLVAVYSPVGVWLFTSLLGRALLNHLSTKGKL